MAILHQLPLSPTYDLSATEDTKNTPEEVDPQSTQTASLEQQMKPEQHTVEAADNPELCRSNQEDKDMKPEHEQLDLETAANQAKTTASVDDERPAENISAESNAFAKTSQRSKTETHQQAAIIRRPTYIPAASKDVGTDDEVAGAAAEAKTRPGLLNRFTGIWSSKPVDSPEDTQPSTTQRQDKFAEKTEPILSRTDVTLPNVEEPVIMDLPAVDVVQPSLPVTTANPDDEDDDLDIPAFLRRQAN